MRRLSTDDRGQVGILRVAVFFGATLFLLYIFAIVGPTVIEPLHEFAVAEDAVQDQGYVETLDRYQIVSLEFAPAVLLGGVIVLVFLYAAFRERFRGPRRPP